MTDHTCTKKICGDSIYFSGHPSRARNRYDNELCQKFTNETWHVKDFNQTTATIFHQWSKRQRLHRVSHQEATQSPYQPTHKCERVHQRLMMKYQNYGQTTKREKDEEPSSRGKSITRLLAKKSLNSKNTPQRTPLKRSRGKEVRKEGRAQLRLRQRAFGQPPRKGLRNNPRDGVREERQEQEEESLKPWNHGWTCNRKAKFLHKEEACKSPHHNMTYLISSQWGGGDIDDAKSIQSSP